jgi:integrase
MFNRKYDSIRPNKRATRKRANVARREVKQERGVFERPKGSGVWWINYYVDGKQHREKAGTRSDAKDLYKERKATARRGEKLPDLRKGRVTLSALIEDVLKFARKDHKSIRDYECKARIVRKAMGHRIAEDLTPQDIDNWLSEHTKAPATWNRYKAFFSLAYRLAIKFGKVKSNPARALEHRKEKNARLRYLSREEYATLAAIIKRDNREQFPSFVVSVYTGMRLTEQFTLAWSQVDFDRRLIRLTKTKNGSARNVPLNSVAMAALESQRSMVPHKAADLIFPRPGQHADYRPWFLPALTEAGITDYTWHSNRHTFCSWLAMAGVSIKEIQVLAGHKTISMSARYAHLSPEVTATASERLVQPTPAV